MSCLNRRRELEIKGKYEIGTKVEGKFTTTLTGSLQENMDKPNIYLHA